MDPFVAVLARKLAECAHARLCVAFSGGADSTALLHALSQLPQAREYGLRALHVDHGLHEDSASWAERCRRFCAGLQVPIEVVRVDTSDRHGEGLEAAARRARHGGFARDLRSGEWLALAHHCDDQIETVLLKLLRGAGPHGLGGMRERRVLGQGVLWRPLLDLPRAVLRDYVTARVLPFVDDPSNSDTRLSRGFLRAEIVPRLIAHWPHAAESIAHSAALNREVSAFLDDRATEALTRLRDAHDGTLDAHGWSALPDALRMLVLERWLHEQGLTAPPPARCAELRRQIEQARADREPCVAWPDGEVRVWRGALHALPSRADIPPGWEAEWNGEPLALPGNAGVLVLRNAHRNEAPVSIDPPLRVGFRRGGERIRPADDAHTRELRDLFQRAGIPPWQRGRIPLIFSGDELIAVAGLWVNAAGKALFDSIAAHPVWQRGSSPPRDN